jgi:hypothetical protein
MRETVEKYRQVFIIVDALDECVEGERGRFVEEMVRLEEHYGARLLVTSRDVPEVTDLLEGSVRLEIVADEGDLRRYAEDRLTRAHPAQRAQEILHTVEASAGR